MMLGDRFVCGPRDVHIQQRLSWAQDLSFRTVYDIALRATCAVMQKQYLK